MEEDSSDGVSQSTMKFFIRHVSGAARRNKEREEKMAHLDSQISVLKDSALSKKPDKEGLEQGFDSLGLKIKEMVSNERLIAVSQQKEKREIDEIMERLGFLEERLNGLDHVHSMISQEHMRKIDDLSRRIRGSIGNDPSSGPSQHALPKQMKNERAENRHKLHPMMTAKDIEKEKKQSEIGKLNEMIRGAEKALRAGGKKINKEQAESIRRKIKIYKRRIKSVRE
ncbi:MAG: hypothetical protein NT001_02355 [Candidatus Woesearchaeota archaeon]|nr:hypothetical protein [Candidatus Woesearchaeota archaeon]